MLQNHRTLGSVVAERDNYVLLQGGNVSPNLLDKSHDTQDSSKHMHEEVVPVSHQCLEM